MNTVLLCLLQFVDYRVIVDIVDIDIVVDIDIDIDIVVATGRQPKLLVSLIRGQCFKCHRSQT